MWPEDEFVDCQSDPWLREKQITFWKNNGASGKQQLSFVQAELELAALSPRTDPALTSWHPRSKFGSACGIVQEDVSRELAEAAVAGAYPSGTDKHIVGKSCCCSCEINSKKTKGVKSHICVGKNK